MSRLYILGGWLLILIMWLIIGHFELINPHVLPTPGKVFKAFGIMYQKYHLVDNALFSLKINFLGYLEAIAFAIPVGFLIGESERGKKLFNQPINALRFVPITALGGIFIALSGLSMATKIHFLAFGIWVYLVPVIIQRMKEIDEVHLQMMQTLGATRWQTFWHVKWKYVTSRLSDDIRILTGISWTYIIVAELKNVQGGLGSMIWLGERQSNPAIVYAILIIIVTFGVLQDLLFAFGDRNVYKFKYA